MEDSLQDRKGLNSFFMLMALSGLMLACLFISLAFVKHTLPVFFGIADVDSFMNIPNEQLKNPLALIYLQAIGSSIGFFLLPVIMYHIIYRYDMVSRMGMRVIPPAKYWLIAIGIMLVAGVFIQLLTQVDAAIPLPAKWQFLRSPQEQVDKMISAFFSDTSTSRFLLLTLVIALLPAVAEEFCFRGTIQNILAGTNLGPIGAIIISGLAFSLVHFEFDNFLAIWCMGIVLGALYYYSGSIWVSVTAHFFNNFMLVAGKYAFMKGYIHADVASSDALPIYVTLPAGGIMVLGLIVLRNWSGKKPVVDY